MDLNVPLLDLTSQYAAIREDVLRAVTRVCDSQRFILGPEVEAFESEMAALIGVEHAVGVSSGTDALLVSMMALGIGPGAEVIVPTFSFFATAGCVSRLGATPVFVDIDPVTFNIDPAAIRRAITARTRAIVVVHLFGLSADMDPILDAARQAGVAVIEDAAQAIGARYRDRSTGAMGTIGCFSFFPTKNLGAFGDGGMVTTPDPALAREVRLLRNHGADPKYVHTRIGGNFRLDALQAAILRVKATHLTAWAEARRRNAERYRAYAAEFGLAGKIDLPHEPAGSHHVYNQFSIRTGSGLARNDLRDFLEARGVGTEIYYPIPFHRQQCFAHLPQPVAAWPVADAVAETVLALPIFGELVADQQRHVMAMIAEFAGRT